MSLTRDMMPAWELRAALDAAEAENTSLRAELERKDAALREAGPHLRKIAGMSCMTCSNLAWATARTVEAALSAQKEEEA